MSFENDESNKTRDPQNVLLDILKFSSPVVKEHKFSSGITPSPATMKQDTLLSKKVDFGALRRMRQQQTSINEMNRNNRICNAQKDLEIKRQSEEIRALQEKLDLVSARKRKLESQLVIERSIRDDAVHELNELKAKSSFTTTTGSTSSEQTENQCMNNSSYGYGLQQSTVRAGTGGGSGAGGGTDKKIRDLMAKKCAAQSAPVLNTKPLTNSSGETKKSDIKTFSYHPSGQENAPLHEKKETDAADIVKTSEKQMFSQAKRQKSSGLSPTEHSEKKQKLQDATNTAQRRPLLAADTVSTVSSSASIAASSEKGSFSAAKQSISEVVAPSQVVANPTTLREHCANLQLSRKPQVQLSALNAIFARLGTGERCSCPKQVQTVIVVLWRSGKPNIALLLETKVPESLVRMLREGIPINNELLHIALEVLNNIVALGSPAQFRAVMDLDFAHLVQPHIASTHEGVQEQAIWTLDNMAGDEACRDKINDLGVVQDILKVLCGKASKKVTVIAAKTLNTLTVGNYFSVSQHAQLLEELLQAVGHLMRSKHAGTYIVMDASAVVANLTADDDKPMIDLVFSCPDIPTRLVELLSAGSAEEQHCAAEALSHLASGSEEQVQTLLSCGLLRGLKGLLQTSQQSDVLSAACRCLSNVTSFDETTLQQVVDAKVVPLLFKIAKQSSTSDENTKVQAGYALMFAIYGASLLQTQYLVEAGVVAPICELLHREVVVGDELEAEAEAEAAEESNDVLVEALASLEVLLTKFEFRSDFDFVAEIVAAAGGWTRIAQLSECDDVQVRDLAGKLDRDQLIARLHARRDITAGTSLGGALTAEADGQEEQEVESAMVDID